MKNKLVAVVAQKLGEGGNEIYAYSEVFDGNGGSAGIRLYIPFIAWNSSIGLTLMIDSYSHLWHAPQANHELIKNTLELL